MRFDVKYNHRYYLLRWYGLADLFVFRPPGKHLKEHDKWKQDFLQQITKKYESKILEFKTQRKTQNYRLVGAPFYNNEDENRFKQSLYDAVAK